jgi:hypothetical protein
MKNLKTLTAYILFSNDQRGQVKSEFPNIQFGEVAKKISDYGRTLLPLTKLKIKHVMNVN